MRVLLRCDLDLADGDPIDLIYALRKAGIEVHLDPIRVAVPLPADIAVLLTRERADSYDLVLHLAAPASLGTDPDLKAAVTIAWTWASEAVNRPEELPDLLAGYDLVIGFDLETVTWLGPSVDLVEQATVQSGYAHRDWPVVERDWYGERFGFCAIGDNPEAVEAFRQLNQQYPQDCGAVELSVSDGDFSTVEALEEFYARHHVMLVPASPRTSAALEFLSTGGTVIAARAGGAQQWLSSALGYPVAYTVEDIKRAMLAAVRDRDEAKRRGETASHLIPDMCSWDKVLDRLFTVIADRVPGEGERLVHTVRVAAERQREKNRR